MSIAPCQPGEAYFQTYYQLHQRRNRQISASLIFNGQSVPWSIQSSCQAHTSLYSPLWSQQPATMEGLWLVMHLKVMHLLYFTTKDEHMTWCKLTQLKTAGAPGPDIWEFWSVSLYEPPESYCNAKNKKVVCTYLKVMPGMCGDRSFWEGRHDPLVQPWNTLLLFSHATTTTERCPI